MSVHHLPFYTHRSLEALQLPELQPFLEQIQMTMSPEGKKSHLAWHCVSGRASAVYSCPVTWQVLTDNSGPQSQASYFIILYRATNRKRDGTKEEIALLVI